MPQVYPSDNSVTLLFESVGAADHFRYWLEEAGGWAAFGTYADEL
jgi:hypothetical protein